MLTKADLDKFAIGGNTKASAKITMEQAILICDLVNCWDKDLYYREEAAQLGATLMGPGVFILDVALGKYPKQPHVVIGADGKGELSNTRMQNFKITYKKTVPTEDPQNALYSTTMKLFTIQTEDGKYLAIEGLPSNGSRLVTRNTEFLWWIVSGSDRIKDKVNIMVPGFHDQRLNACESSTRDGAPIITWYEENKWKNTTGADYPHNTEFNYYMVHGVKSNTPTLAKKLTHGHNLMSYPVKTTYKVGEGFDGTGFKMIYKDYNNKGKTTDISTNYGFYTTDGVKLKQGTPFKTVGTKLIEIKWDDIGNGVVTLDAIYFVTVTD